MAESLRKTDLDNDVVAVVSFAAEREMFRLVAEELAGTMPAELGDFVLVGGAAGIVGHVKIGDRAQSAATIGDWLEVR